MIRNFILKTDRVEVVEAFARKEVPGVSISFPSVPARKLAACYTKRGITYDAAEGILEFIVSAARDIDINLFAAWLYTIVQKSSSKKTTVNGQELTGSITQVTVIIQNILQVNHAAYIYPREGPMSIRVIYSTEAFLVKSKGQLGKQYEISFASLEEAKAAPLPAGYVHAYIPAENGHHSYSAKLGWEFHKK